MIFYKQNLEFRYYPDGRNDTWTPAIPEKSWSVYCYNWNIEAIGETLEIAMERFMATTKDMSQYFLENLKHNEIVNFDKAEKL